MATLLELSQRYLEEAVRLKACLRALTAEAEQERDPHRRRRIEHDRRLVDQMLREAREVAGVTRHYYEEGYWRDKRYTL